jgi:acyl-CoA thioesterase I
MGVFRAIYVVTLVALTAAAAGIGNATAGDAPVKIVNVGDSYIVGYGLHSADAFPTKLQTALTSRGHSVEVIDMGFKKTSRSGIIWLEGPDGQKLLAAPTNHVVILELGGNDCNSLTVDQTRTNLDLIVAKLTEERIPVLIVGTEPNSYCAGKRGADYDVAYRQIFPDLAKKYDAMVYPDFKDGVSGHPELLQLDNDHPNREGEAIIVEKMLPFVEVLIAKLTQH